MYRNLEPNLQRNVYLLLFFTLFSIISELEQQFFLLLHFGSVDSLLFVDKTEGGSSSQALLFSCFCFFCFKHTNNKLLSVQLCLSVSLCSTSPLWTTIPRRATLVSPSLTAARGRSCCSYRQTPSRLNQALWASRGTVTCETLELLELQPNLSGLERKSSLILLENRSGDNLGFIETPAAAAAWKLPVASAVEREKTKPA